MSCPFCHIIKQLSSSPLFVQLFKADPTSPFEQCKHSKMPGVRDLDMPDLDDIPLPILPPLPPDDGLGLFIPRVAQQNPGGPQGAAFEEMDRQPGQPELPAQQPQVAEMNPEPGTSSGYVASAPIDIPIVSGAGERAFGDQRMQYTRAQLRNVLDDTLEAGPPYEFEAEVQFPVTYPPAGFRSNNGPKRRSVYPKVEVMPIDSDDDDKDEGLPVVARAFYDIETDNVAIGWSQSLSDAMRRTDEAEPHSVSNEDDDEDNEEDDGEDDDEDAGEDGDGGEGEYGVGDDGEDSDEDDNQEDDRNDAEMMDWDHGDVAAENVDENVNQIYQNMDENVAHNVVEEVDQNIAQNVYQNGDQHSDQNDDAGDQADRQHGDQDRELAEDEDLLQACDSPSPPSVNGYDPFDMFYSDDGEEDDEEVDGD